MVDGDGLVDKMVEIMAATSRHYLEELIAALPEILPQSQHNTMADHLLKMLEETNPMISILVDCLGNLELSPELVQRTKTALVHGISSKSFKFSDLPNVLDFLLSSVDNKLENNVELVMNIRDHLDLTEKMRPSQRVGPSSVKNKENRELDSKKNIERILLDKINISMMTEKKMLDAWCHTLEGIKDVEDVRPLDMIVMVMLYKNKQKRRSVEMLMKNKIRNAVITNDLIQSIFTNHKAFLIMWKDTVLDMSLALMLSSERVISECCARQLFISAFINLDEFCEREVISLLVSCINRTDTALLVLCDLATQHADKMAKYGWYLVGLLDHVSESMEVSMLRNIIIILAKLAWRKGSDSAGTQIRDDVVIFVKKQVQSGIIQYKKMGVVGAVVVAHAMVTACEEEDIGVPIAESSRHSRSGSIILTGLGVEAWDLLEFVSNKTNSHPELAGLFLDEMCFSFVDSLMTDKNFLEKFRERFSSNVEEVYVEDVEEEESDRYGVKMKYAMLLDDEQDSDGKPISITLAQKIATSVGLGLDTSVITAAMKKGDAELAKLLPSVRLLIKTMSLTSDGLDDIDALLGCGVWIFDHETIKINDLQPEQRTAVLHSLFYIINWFIELINGFSKVKDEDIKKKVLVRLKQIVSLKETLVKCLKTSPQYRPPTTLFSEDTSDWQPPSAVQKKTRKNSGKKGKKSKKTPTETMMNATLNLNTQRPSQMVSQQVKASQRQEEVSPPAPVDLQFYKPFFRELDLSCLNILKVEPVTTESSPSLSQELKDPRLRPEEMLFLMKDLLAKLDKSLGLKRKGFPGKQSLSSVGFTNLQLQSQEMVVTEVADSLKYILAHMDQLREYFKRLEMMKDDSVDLLSMCTSSPDSITIMELLKVCLQSLTVLFSWPGFNSSVNKQLLVKCLREVVTRVSNDVDEEAEVGDLAEQVLKYLEQFSLSSVLVDMASAHLGLMAVIKRLDSVNSDNQSPLIAKVASAYLKTEWRQCDGTPEKGAEFNAQIEKILNIFIANSSNISKDLKLLCAEGTHLLVEKKDSELFPFINKSTMSPVYKVVLSSLVTEVKKMKYGSSKDQDEQFAKWMSEIETLVRMILDLKKFATRILFVHVLTYSRSFIEHFIKEGDQNIK